MFNLWEEWAQTYENERNSIENTLDKTQETTIRPLGDKVAPEWMKYEFKDLEEFYQYYIKLLNIGD